MDCERVVIAEIVKPRGNHGEVLAISRTDIPGRLESLKKGNARLIDGADLPVDLEAAWQHKDHWVFKFVGVDSIDAAARFRGAELWIPLLERAPLPEGDFFESDLIGCEVYDAREMKPIGTVVGWQHYGGPPLMEVLSNGKEILIPFVKLWCKVNLQERSIQADLPEGLLGL